MYNGDLVYGLVAGMMNGRDITENVCNIYWPNTGQKRYNIYGSITQVSLFVHTYTIYTCINIIPVLPWGLLLCLMLVTSCGTIDGNCIDVWFAAGYPPKFTITQQHHV